MFDLTTFNPLAVSVATGVGAALGALWYSPAMLRNRYVAALGKPEVNLQSPLAILGSVVSCLVAVTSVAVLVSAAGARTTLAGALVGLIVGIVVAMTMLSDCLFSRWGWRLYFIQGGYRVLYLIIAGAICGGWPR